MLFFPNLINSEIIYTKVLVVPACSGKWQELLVSLLSFDFLQLAELYIYPWRALQISKDGDDQRIFGGPKFFIPGFLWGRKILQVLFWGGLI